LRLPLLLQRLVLLLPPPQPLLLLLLLLLPFLGQLCLTVLLPLLDAERRFCLDRRGLPLLDAEHRRFLDFLDRRKVRVRAILRPYRLAQP